MKHFLLPFLFCFALQMSAQVVPLYMNLGSHNEINDPNNYNSPVVWDSVSTYLRQISDSVKFYHARWNLMVESNFILANLTRDNAYLLSSDLLQTLDTTAHIEVDPHNHQDTVSSGLGANPYNYADLAYLLDSCGLIPKRTNLGGFFWRDFSSTEKEDWTRYQYDSVPGYVYPHKKWKPVVICGGGSPGHTDDYSSMGFWRPDTSFPSAQFGVHDSTNSLVCMGAGCGMEFVIFDSTTISRLLADIATLSGYINDLPPDPNAFHTITIMFNFRDLLSPGYIDKIFEFLRGTDAMRASGQIVWGTTTERLAMWNALHPHRGDYFNFQCDWDAITPIEGTLPELKSGVWPNPADQHLNIDCHGMVHIFDPRGVEIYSGNGGEVATDRWPSGIYLMLDEASGSVTRISVLH